MRKFLVKIDVVMNGTDTADRSGCSDVENEGSDIIGVIVQDEEWDCQEDLAKVISQYGVSDAIDPVPAGDFDEESAPINRSVLRWTVKARSLEYAEVLGSVVGPWIAFSEEDSKWQSQ